jgi:hypothetical protein
MHFFTLRSAPIVIVYNDFFNHKPRKFLSVGLLDFPGYDRCENVENISFVQREHLASVKMAGA